MPRRHCIAIAIVCRVHHSFRYYTLLCDFDATQPIFISMYVYCSAHLSSYRGKQVKMSAFVSWTLQRTVQLAWAVDCSANITEFAKCSCWFHKNWRAHRALMRCCILHLRELELAHAGCVTVLYLDHDIHESDAEYLWWFQLRDTFMLTDYRYIIGAFDDAFEASLVIRLEMGKQLYNVREILSDDSKRLMIFIFLIIYFFFFERIGDGQSKWNVYDNDGIIAKYNVQFIANRKLSSHEISSNIFQLICPHVCACVW